MHTALSATRPARQIRVQPRRTNSHALLSVLPLSFPADPHPPDHPSSHQHLPARSGLIPARPAREPRPGIRRHGAVCAGCAGRRGEGVRAGRRRLLRSVGSCRPRRAGFEQVSWRRASPQCRRLHCKAFLSSVYHSTIIAYRSFMTR